MSNILTGVSTLSYLGVRAPSPANTFISGNQQRHEAPRDPTSKDYRGFNIGDYWINSQPNLNPKVYRLWWLASKYQNIATWVLITNGSGGALNTLTASDGTVATPVLANITFPDAIIAGSGNIDSNLQSHGAVGLFTMNLKPAIRLPVTNAALTQGVIYLGVNRFLHGYGTANTFLGNAAGNPTLTVGSAVQNTGIGNAALAALTTGSSNTAVGANGLTQLTTGIDNTAIGNGTLSALSTGSANTAFGGGSLTSLATGSINIAIGGGSGSAYTGAESSNILIGNTGTLGESNTIRIGTDGVGPAQQNVAYIAGDVFATRSLNTISGNITANGAAAIITDNMTGNNTGGGIIQITKSRNGGVITSGDTLGTFSIFGYDGTNFVQGAAIASVNSGTVAANRVAGNLLFATHPDSATGLGATNRMTISPAGNLSLNAPDSGIAATITGSIAVGGDEGGTALYNTFTNGSDLTANGAGTFTIKSKSANNLDSSGFIKIYIGATAYYIPVFNDVAP